MEFTSHGRVSEFIPPGRHLGMPERMVEASSPANNVLQELDEAAIRALLPHSDLAVVLQKVLINDPTQATGYFLVSADDPRIRDHFGIMPGVLIAEFAHLTGAVLMAVTNPGFMCLLTSSTFAVREIAKPGDELTCEVTLTDSKKREASFSGTVRNNRGEEVMVVSFSGQAVSQRAFRAIMGINRVAVML